MKATQLEFRLRELLAVLVCALGFWAPWERYTGLSTGGSSLWTAAASWIYRQQWLGFSAGSRALLIFSMAAATVAALLRWWAASYPQPDRLASRAELPIGGPYRYARQPGAVAFWLQVAALGLLMPPSGAAAALVLAVVLELRLSGYQEGRALTHGGSAYAAYAQLVPRFVPASVRPRVAGTAGRANWLTGLLSSVLSIGTAAAFVVEGSTYNGTAILRWVLVAFGLQLILSAVQPSGRRMPIA